MKKFNFLIKGILSIFIFVIGIHTIDAASAHISVSSSASRIMVGNTFTVTMTISSSSEIGSWQWSPDYSSNTLALISSDFEGADTLSHNGQTSASYNYTFKAIASGSGYISVKSYEAYAGDFNRFDLSAGSASVSIISQAELAASYSKDNYLKSLSVSGATISPGFNKDTKEYTAKVDSSVEKITIGAETNDSRASLTGTGEFEVSEGENKFQIIVTAENGSKSTYTLTVIVEDPNPIKVKTTDEKELVVVKRNKSLTKPNTFQETKVSISQTEIPAFYSEITKITLVGLKDEKGNIKLYEYDKSNNTYSLYREITFNSLVIYPKDLKEDSKFNNYIKTTIKVNDEEVEVYKLNETTKYSVFYGLNIETNEENYYLYDKKENSIIRYTSETEDILNEKLLNYKKIIIILIGETLILFMILIFTIISNGRKKKKIKQFIQSNHSKQNIIDDTKKQKNEKKEEILKEEEKAKEFIENVNNKKRKKEKKKKLKDQLKEI